MSFKKSSCLCNVIFVSFGFIYTELYLTLIQIKTAQDHGFKSRQMLGYENIVFLKKKVLKSVQFENIGKWSF